MGKPAMEPEVQSYLRRLEADSPVELGGVTGDVFGLIVEMSELAILLGFVVQIET